MNITFGEEDSSSEKAFSLVSPKQSPCSGLKRPLPIKLIMKDRPIQINYSKSDFANPQFSNQNISFDLDKKINQATSATNDSSYDYDYDYYDYEYDEETESESSSFILIKNPKKTSPILLNKLKSTPNLRNRPQNQQNYSKNPLSEIPFIQNVPQSDSGKYDLPDKNAKKVINYSNSLKTDCYNNNSFIDLISNTDNCNECSTINNDNIHKNNNIINFYNNQKQNTDSRTEIYTRPVKHFQNDMIKYRMTRSHKISIHGKTTFYQLYKNDILLLHTKVKTMKSNGICYIAKGPELHSKNDKNIGAILFVNNRTTFSVRKNNEFGEEIMTIIYKPGNYGAPRQMTIFFPNIQKNIPQNLFNKVAILDDYCNWALDTKGKFIMKSIKNCIIVNKRNREFATVLKIEKETIEIEAKDAFSHLIIFAIGLSSFLCKL